MISKSGLNAGCLADVVLGAEGSVMNRGGEAGRLQRNRSGSNSPRGSATSSHVQRRGEGACTWKTPSLPRGVRKGVRGKWHLRYQTAGAVTCLLWYQADEERVSREAAVYRILILVDKS